MQLIFTYILHNFYTQTLNIVTCRSTRGIMVAMIYKVTVNTTLISSAYVRPTIPPAIPFARGLIAVLSCCVFASLRARSIQIANPFLINLTIGLITKEIWFS